MSLSGRRPGEAARFTVLLATVFSLWLPGDASAQLGAIEAFARRVTDLSFNAHIGGLSPGSKELDSSAFGLRSFGLELLFEIGSVERVTGPAPPVADTATLTWTSMTVVRGPDGVDTTYVYEVGPPPRRPAPTETLWTFEMGIGYGQLVGFDSGQESLDLKGQVRDLPSATLYASYEPIGSYFGLRSGFMRLQGLQAFDEEGNPFTGKGESFLLAGLVGHAVEALGINLFFEATYSVRYFPSVEWRTVAFGTSLPLELPRDLSFSGWSIGTGVQFGMGN